MNFTQEQLQQIQKMIDERLSKFDFSDRFIFYKLLQMLDGRNIQAGLTNGTKIGLSVSEKWAMHGSTPVIQRSGAAQTAVSGTADGTYSANEVTLINDLVTLTNELRAALVEKGIIKGSS